MSEENLNKTDFIRKIPKFKFSFCFVLYTNRHKRRSLIVLLGYNNFIVWFFSQFNSKLLYNASDLIFTHLR